jgi:hypothetical protein
LNSLLPALAEAFFCTVTVEYMIFLVLIRKNPGMLLIYTVLINGLTNPLLNYVYLYHCPVLWPLETGVIIVESILLALLAATGWRKAFICAICANCASILVGKLLSTGIFT